ncbi:LpqP [Parvularcula bermudensis HTCC2503]|uniref:LpqP n=1 Tax=Parvularcula bermudensis (strain ATCC BAA-594 / HTCC2503 / KCTC 12087) TaxID=314260 RepID=E0TFE1_PARBH|nr:PHB depolymerase family esterase [Parvularcula bermudensis]ADM09542.1 LpqP [Parvularcula bermudensis HTCC2503]
MALRRRPVKKALKQRRRLRKEGLSRFSLLHDDQPRRSLISVPQDGEGPFPLVIALHPGKSHPLAMAKITKFHRLGEQEGFITAYPAGSGRRPRSLSWNASPDDKRVRPAFAEVDDLDFLEHFVDELVVNTPVDPKAIFVTGFSQGAAMAYTFASAMAGRIAGLAAVAGAMTDFDRPAEAPLSVIHVHGDRDENVPFRGGRGRFTHRRRRWPAVKEGLDYWASASNVDLPDLDDALSQCQGPVQTVRAQSSNGGATVEFNLIKGSGHAWPGRKPTLWQRALRIPVYQGYQTTQQIWSFFQDCIEDDCEGDPPQA